MSHKHSPIHPHHIAVQKNLVLHTQLLVLRRNKGHISRCPDRESLHIIKGMVVNIIYLPEGQMTRMWQPEQAIRCCAEKQVWLNEFNSSHSVPDLSSTGILPCQIKNSYVYGREMKVNFRTFSKGKIEFQAEVHTLAYFTWNIFSFIVQNRALQNGA